MLVEKKSTRRFAKVEAGGKGFNLYRLSNAGVRVPGWKVLGKRHFEIFLSANDLEKKINELVLALEASEINARQCSQQISNMILACKIPVETVQLIQSAFESICAEESVGMISVRSSAADEDGGVHSFAGQL